MLVLSRQRGQVVMIGDDTEVKVVDIRGDKVRLGITAPREVPVHRREVYDAIRRENRAAAAEARPGEIVAAGGSYALAGESRSAARARALARRAARKGGA